MHKEAIFRDIAQAKFDGKKSLTIPIHELPKGMVKELEAAGYCVLHTVNKLLPATITVKLDTK
jgi:hypothetical protein